MESEHIGYTYRDRITGFTGVCTGHTVYITGCSQLLIQPAAEDRDAKWIDEQRMERQIDFRITLDNSQTPGCDLAAPVR